ncbi:MAG: cobalamin transport system substrate-binding protein [Chloroflexota bacterium]|jgi:iron complex transport system substrate-binding protein|nr:cobalamin transport system substrate-binding protein [Chloroflexota bacterium]
MTAHRLSALLLILIGMLGACARPPSSSTAPSDPASAPPTVSDSAPAADYPLTLTDDAGREVSLAAEPQAIVSLAPSNTEIVCALDACDRLVGVTDFDDYPPEVVDVDKVVTMAQVDVEAVVAAEPDLVLAAGNELTPTSVIDQLAGLGLPVLVLYPESLDEVSADVELVGTAIGQQDEATALVDGMDERIAAVEEAVADLERPQTFYEVSVFEGVIYTAGDGSFLAGLIDAAGGEPITGDALSTSIEIEDLVAADPELILLGDATYDETITPESVAARPGWDAMAAVEDGQVLVVTDDVVITRPGPRIVDGLEALARAIHPDAFAD